MTVSENENEHSELQPTPSVPLPTRTIDSSPARPSRVSLATGSAARFHEAHLILDYDENAGEYRLVVTETV